MEILMSTVEKTEKNVVTFEFSITGDEFKAAIEKAYRQNVGKINIQGFRRGKAPRHIIERYYGSEVFYEDAINIALPDAYDKAIDEQNIEAIAQPEIDVKDISKETGVVFTAKVAVKPEFELGEYKGVKVQKVIHRTTEKEINGEIEKIRERNARLVTVEDRAAKLDDTVNIDFEGFADGVAFEGGKGENFDLKLGSGQFIPGFEDQLVGKSTGEETEVNVTFPTEYHSEDLKGKDAMFKVKINAIKTQELPELDDEFVKDATEFETLDELKADIKVKFEEHAARNAEIEADNKLYEALINKMTADIPEIMYESKIDEMVRDFEMRLSQQGLNLEMYLTYTNMDMTAFRKTFEEQAQKQVKVRLALEKIAELENVEISDAQVDEEINKMAEQYNLTADKIKAIVSPKAIKSDLKVAEASKIVKDSAKFNG